MRAHKLIVLTLVLFWGCGSACADDAADAWRHYRPLVGHWIGAGSGFGVVSDVEHHWEFVIHDKFLRLQTRSTARQEDGAGEVHEDVGYLSQDTDRSAFVFRQFLSEGSVNTFDMSTTDREPATLLFGVRESESAGGMRVQMRLTFLSANEYEMVLELAGPGKDFSPCQTMRMKRQD